MEERTCRTERSSLSSYAVTGSRSGTAEDRGTNFGTEAGHDDTTEGGGDTLGTGDDCDTDDSSCRRRCCGCGGGGVGVGVEVGGGSGGGRGEQSRRPSSFSWSLSFGGGDGVRGTGSLSSVSSSSLSRPPSLSSSSAPSMLIGLSSALPCSLGGAVLMISFSMARASVSTVPVICCAEREIGVERRGSIS